MDYEDKTENTDEIIDPIELSSRDILAIKSALWQLADYFGIGLDEGENKDITISYLAGYLRECSVEGKPVDILDALVEFCGNCLKTDVTHFERPKNTEKRSGDIGIVALFFLDLGYHFGLPLDVKSWRADIELLADFLRISCESGSPDVMKVFSEFYIVVLKKKLSRYFRAEVGKLTTVN